MSWYKFELYRPALNLTLVPGVCSYTKPSAEKLERRLGEVRRHDSLSDVSVHIGMGELRRPSPKLSLLDRFVNYSRVSINSLRSDKHSMNSMALSEPDKHSLLVGDAHCEEEVVWASPIQPPRESFVCDAAWVSLHRFDCPAVRITKDFQRLSVYITSILAGPFKGIVHPKTTILSFSCTFKFSHKKSILHVCNWTEKNMEPTLFTISSVVFCS